MIGKTISHYKIMEKLGSGGMGVVYKAEDTKLKRTVALKFLPPSLSIDSEAKNRFIHEAQAASALDHTNICTIYEIDETDDHQLFMAMSCYDGETLKQKIEHGPLPFKEASSIVYQIVQGLAKTHEKGIIHRDIKPANIMITNDGVVKILDFGLAKLTGRTMLTKEGTTLGTISYMSPEQTRGDSVDHRTDIWSLGIIFYEMLTGQLPFKGEYDQAVMYSILNEEPNPVSSLNDNMPTELDQIITKIMAKKPDDRYRQIDEFIEDLLHLKEGTLKKRKRLKRTEKKRLLFLTSISVIVLIVFTVLFYPTKTIPFSERDWILITDFENHTNESIFDKSLYTAFSLSIDQSRYVNVLSKRRMLETLKRMKKSGTKVIDEEAGREIAIREGIGIFVAPSISRAGEKYALMGKIQEVKGNNILESEVLYADGKNEILETLDKLSHNIRKELGESRFSIATRSKPLTNVTTSSLEALKQYSLGIENHLNLNFEQAKNYYENALKIDTNFTSARASLGNLLFERFDRKKGKELLAEAVKYVENLTDKEKYGILAFHAINVENDYEKGIKFTRMRIDLYPDDPIAHNNLGWYYHNLGRFNEAVLEYKSALKINPYLLLTYGGLIWIYCEKLAQLDSAMVWSKHLLFYDDENAWGYFYLGSSYVGKDSLSEAERAYKKASELNPNLNLNTYRLAHVYRLQGQYQKSIQILKGMLKVHMNEASAHYDLGINYQMMGDIQAAKKHFSRFKEYAEKWVQDSPENAASYISLAVVLTRLGEKQQGWDIGCKAIELDSTLHLSFAELLTTQGKKEKALIHLEKALQKGYKNLVWLKLNPDLELLQNEPGYKKLINQYFIE
ncbi:MAG: protein kinase [Candidatus Marinimicrobia bacterium]|nr:protein kinase [Candidatus Neomarinimicrobiota bacterium]